MSITALINGYRVSQYSDLMQEFLNYTNSDRAISHCPGLGGSDTSWESWSMIQWWSDRARVTPGARERDLASDWSVGPGPDLWLADDDMHDDTHRVFWCQECGASWGTLRMMIPMSPLLHHVPPPGAVTLSGSVESWPSLHQPPWGHHNMPSDTEREREREPLHQTQHNSHKYNSSATWFYFHNLIITLDRLFQTLWSQPRYGWERSDQTHTSPVQPHGIDQSKSSVTQRNVMPAL